jgi:hypothetical protein
MSTTIDTAKAHRTRQHGDITAIYTWVNDERALVLVPTLRPGAPWFIVCESAAYRYDNDIYIVKQAIKACKVLGLASSHRNILRIGTLIEDGLPDLIRIPTRPETEASGKKYGELKVMANGTQIGGEDIRIENEVPTYA